MSSKKLIQLVLLQQVPDFVEYRLVRNALGHEVNAHKLSHGIAVIDRVLGSRIGKVEPVLHQIRPKHPLNPYGRIASFAIGVKRRNDADPFLSRG